MAYSSVTKVEELLPDTVWIDHTTHPTIVTVEGWLEDLDGVINVALATGGSTSPATDPEMLAKLDLLEGKEAAYMVMQARGATDHDETPALWQQYHQEFIDAIELFQTPGSAIGTSPTIAPSSYTLQEPAFKRCKAGNF